MPTYSYQPCTDPRVGATVFEDDNPILVTAHQEGWGNGDHDDLAEYICSTMTIMGVGKESPSITNYIRLLEEGAEVQRVGEKEQAC